MSLKIELIPKVTFLPDDVRGFLESIGWNVVNAAPVDGFCVMSKAEFPNRQLLFPFYYFAPDYKECLDILFDKLAFLERSSVKLVTKDLEEFILKKRQKPFVYEFRVQDYLFGEFVLFETGLYEFIPIAGGNGGYVVIEVYESIVNHWNELNRDTLEDQRQFFEQSDTGDR